MGLPLRASRKLLCQASFHLVYEDPSNLVGVLRLTILGGNGDRER